MAFLPQAFYNQDTSFTPLFRLLDDFSSYSRQNHTKASRQCALPHWQPKFDIRETADSYELHGELPGVTRENVNIEFTEPQTLHIRGKVERTYNAGTSPVAQTGNFTAGSTSPETVESQKSRRATVEDEDDEEWSNAEHSRPPTPSTTESKNAQPAQEKKPADRAKYWLTERSIGEFSRSFSFPNRVDEENVSATFQDGILSIVVPKAKKHESRRIVIV